MAKEKLGTKRICPETGKKFYDLGRDPIVSPYTGISYPLSAFDLPGKKASVPADEETKDKAEEDTETEEATSDAPADIEVVSLEDAEPDTSDDDDDDDESDDVIPDIDTTDLDDEVGGDDDDSFLEEEDDENTNVGVIPTRESDD
ncbi:MAG: TIGR02300 family protein [Pseudomonadota bacterium]